MSFGYIAYVSKLIACKIIMKCRRSDVSDAGTSSEHEIWDASVVPRSVTSSDVALIPVSEGDSSV